MTEKDKKTRRRFADLVIILYIFHLLIHLFILPDNAEC